MENSGRNFCGYIPKMCKYCKHLIGEYEIGQFLCGADKKRYKTDHVDEHGCLVNKCMNGLFERIEKIPGRR